MLGDRIKELRKQKGLTQKQLAEKVGISENYVIKIERNLKHPHIKTLVRLAGYLDVGIESLVWDKED